VEAEKAVNKKPFVFVGKGVVFDSGGMNLKPGESMSTMKEDMAGAAAVASAIYAIALAGLPVHVIGLMPATDNRPGPNAIVPGDVINMQNGMTVEVLNTDAEGRLILADALNYATRYKPSLVIDLATLTGSAIRAVGKYGIVAMQKNAVKELDLLKESGMETYERLVEFPAWDEYAEGLKSEIADMKNIGPAEAGAITAGKFLEKFTAYPYIHLDIAGPAFIENGIHTVDREEQVLVFACCLILSESKYICKKHRYEPTPRKRAKDKSWHYTWRCEWHRI